MFVYKKMAIIRKERRRMFSNKKFKNSMMFHVSKIIKGKPRIHTSSK